MTDDELDRRSRAEAARISTEAAAIADTDAALAAVLDPPPKGAARSNSARRRPSRLLIGVLAGGVAAALTVVVAVAVAIERDGSSPQPVATQPPGPVATIAEQSSSITSSIASSIATSSVPEAPPASPTMVAPPGTENPATRPTTTAPADPTAIDMLAGWPAATASAPSIDDVPRMLASIEGADRIEQRAGSDASTDYADYVQEFVAAEGPAATLSITTRPRLSIGALPREPNAQLRAVPGWDDAQNLTTFNGVASATLVEPSGSVRLAATGMSDDELLAIARSMRRRPSAPGWDLDLPSTTTFGAHDFVPLADGWTAGLATRRLVWFAADSRLAEVSITAGGAGAVLVNVYVAGKTTVDNVGGALAVVHDHGAAGAEVEWHPFPGITVVAGYRGSVDDALAFARSLQVVDEATWETATVPSDYYDGCDSLFC